jgi:hypothetical protein
MYVILVTAFGKRSSRIKKQAMVEYLSSMTIRVTEFYFKNINQGITSIAHAIGR